jgi:hypothetical protein
MCVSPLFTESVDSSHAECAGLCGLMLRRGEHTADSAVNGSGREHEDEHEPATRNDTGRGNGASSDLREAGVDRAIRAMYRDHVEWLDEQQVCALSSLTSALSGARHEKRYLVCCFCSVRSLHPRPMLRCHSSVWLICVDRPYRMMTVS